MPRPYGMIMTGGLHRKAHLIRLRQGSYSMRFKRRGLHELNNGMLRHTFGTNFTYWCRTDNSLPCHKDNHVCRWCGNERAVMYGYGIPHDTYFCFCNVDCFKTWLVFSGDLECPALLLEI